jgi:hypothetical protein
MQVLRGTGTSLVIPCPASKDLDSIQYGVEYWIKIEKKYSKRSLSANAYAWVLCQKIAEALTRGGAYMSKEEVYRKAIKDCGHFTIIPMRDDALDRFRNIWSSKGIGWITDVMGPCKRTPGYSNVMVYHGSSVYTSYEMQRLLECLVDEAQQIGVSTKQQEEIDSLLKEWSSNETG